MPTQTSAIELQREIKRFLKRVAVRFAEFLKIKLGTQYSRSNPATSMDYPRKRTGSLQASCSFQVQKDGHSIVVGIVHPILLNGKKYPPTRYGGKIEFVRQRKLTLMAWNEFWPTIDHRLNARLGAGLMKTLVIKQIDKDSLNKESFFEIEGLDEFLSERPSIYARESGN